MELKKCARCGKFYISEVDVCNDCERKDTVELNKLKGFLIEGAVTKITKGEILASTGISSKNLNRYLGYEDFNNINIIENETLVNNNSNQNNKTENVNLV